jgi:hypothetical protein
MADGLSVLVRVAKHILVVVQLLHLRGLLGVPCVGVQLAGAAIDRVAEHTGVHLVCEFGADGSRRCTVLLLKAAGPLRLLLQSTVDVPPGSQGRPSASLQPSSVACILHLSIARSSISIASPSP